MIDPQFLQNHPAFFDSLKYLQDADRKPTKRTFIVAQPRSGSTLLARLLQSACLSRCVGDKQPAYYQSLFTLYRDIRDNQGQYCDYHEAEQKDVFADECRVYDSREREMLNFKYSLSQLLFANTFGSGYAKATNLGFANEYLGDFVAMLREVYEADDLTIVYLTRPIPECVESMYQKGVIERKQFPYVHECYEKQLQQMRESSEFGDVWIDYHQLIENPLPFLKKCNPIYTPKVNVTQDVLMKKLK